MLYAPLLSAVLIAGQAGLELLLFLVAVTGVFLAHEPLARLARAGWPLGGERPRTWWSWVAVEGALAGLAGAWLWLGAGLTLLPVFGLVTGALLALHLQRVGRRSERTVFGEIVGIAGLTLTLPGALYVMNGRLGADAAWLWALHVAYFVGGIFYVKARVSGFVGRAEAGRWRLASDLYHVVAVLGANLAGLAGWIPPLASAALLPALIRALWGVRQLPERLNMRRIGYGEVIVTVLFVVLLVAGWRLGSNEGAMTSVEPELRFTYHDYLQLPEDKQYELIDGEFFLVPAPRPFHQIVSGRLVEFLSSYVRSRGLGVVVPAPCDVYFSRYDTVQPDVIYIRQDRLGIVKENYVEGAPDLVVEVLSPSTADKDRDLKRKLYARYREYWIVDADARTVQVLSRRRGRMVEVRLWNAVESLETHMIEGFRLPLEEVFQPL